MMAEHTPGPWKVVDGDSHNGYPHEPSEYEYRVVPESTEPRPNNIIASFWDCEWGYEALGNAHLIAAAPDLLAALKEIEKGEGAFSLDPLTFASNAIENMKGIATAAIAKAEGER